MASIIGDRASDLRFLHENGIAALLAGDRLLSPQVMPKERRSLSQRDWRER